MRLAASAAKLKIIHHTPHAIPPVELGSKKRVNLFKQLLRNGI